LGVAALALLILAACAQEPRESTVALVERFERQTIFWRQLEVAEKLTALRERSVLRRLEPWLMHEDRHLRGNAALVFARLGDERGFQVIAEMLNDRSVREEGQGMPAAPWTLHGQIAADRYYAVHLLGLLKDRRGVGLLAPLLDDEDLNYKIPWALGQIGGEAAEKALTGALNHRSTEVRRWSAGVLGELNARHALPHLRRLLDDHQRSRLADTITVAEAARRAIEKLEGKR
jgi:HEAT repeat protein